MLSTTDLPDSTSPLGAACAQSRPHRPEDAHSWSILHAQCRTRLLFNGCPQYVEGYYALGLDSGRIESVGTLSRRLADLTGWTLLPVDGLLPHREFALALRDRRFPASWQLRPPHSLHFSATPDFFHDIMGHLPLLTHPAYSAFLSAYADVACEHLSSPQACELLERIYWYTFETGLVRERERHHVLGAAIVTSQSEWLHVNNPSTPHLEFDLDRVMDLPIDYSQVQAHYFVLPSFESLRSLASDLPTLLHRRTARRPQMPTP